MDLLNKYDERTTKAIWEFIEDFQAIFPGLLSKEELIMRINTNLKSINFEADLDDKTLGRYVNNNILINKKVFEKGQTLFHEFIHVITDGAFLQNKDYKNFIEGMTTLAEEKYMQYKEIKKPKYRRNINGYIPTFVRELNFITDGEALEQFLVSPESVSDSFLSVLLKFDLPPSVISKNKKNLEFNSFLRTNEAIVLNAIMGNSDQVIVPMIIELEKKILQQYFLRIKTNKEKFNTEKFKRLYEMQMYPNVEEYLNTLKDFSNLGILSENEVSLCGVFGLFYQIDEVDENIISELSHNVLTDAEIDWLASKCFGYHAYLYDKRSLLCFENVDVEKICDEEYYYEYMKPVYRRIMEEILEGNFSLKDIENCKIKLNKPLSETFSVQSYLKDDKSAQQKLMDVLLGNEDDEISTYAILDDSGIKMIQSKEFFYSQIGYTNFIEMILNTNYGNKEKLISYLEKYENVDVIYVDSCVEMDIEEFENRSLTFFASSNGEVSEITLYNIADEIAEKVEKITFIGDSKDLFEKDTMKKLVNTSV